MKQYLDQFCVIVRRAGAQAVLRRSVWWSPSSGNVKAAARAVLEAAEG